MLQTRQIFIILLTILIIVLAAVLVWRYVSEDVVLTLVTIRDASLLALQIAGISFLLYIVTTIIIWVFRPGEGILIVSFDVIRYEGKEAPKKRARPAGRKEKEKPAADDKDSKDFSIGKSLSDALITELVRISRIHQRERERPGPAVPRKMLMRRRASALPLVSTQSWDTTSADQSSGATLDPLFSSRASSISSGTTLDPLFSSRASGILTGTTAAPGQGDRESGTPSSQFELKEFTKGSKALPGRMINIGTKSPIVLTDAGTVGLGGSSISISGMLMLFKQLRANRDAEIVISGSMQSFKTFTRLTARLERTGKPLLICQVSDKIEGDEKIVKGKDVEKDEKIHELVRDLAFNIWQETLPSSVKSWKWLKYFTEALDGYQQYELTEEESCLEVASKNCLAAADIPHGYRSLFELSYNLAEIFYSNENYSEAEKLYSCAIRVYDITSSDAPTDNQVAEVYNRLGLSLAFQKKTMEAENAFRNVIDKNPKHPEAYFYLTITLAERDRVIEAKEIMDKAREQGLLEKIPSIKLGNFYSNLGLKEEAEKTYLRATESKTEDGYPHYLLGNLYSDRGDLEEAVEQYKRAIELSPEQPLPYIELGFIYYNWSLKTEQNFLAEAKSKYEQANKLTPGYPSSHNNLGVIHEDENDIQSAIAEYNRALEVDPTFLVSYNNLARLYLKIKQPEDAIAIYRRALMYITNDPSIHNELGLIYNDLERIDEAIYEYNMAIGINPGFAFSYNNLGVAYEKLDQTDEAIKEYQQALKLDPALLVSYSNLARIYKQQGRLDDAVAEYERGIAQNPALSFLHTDLGFLYDQQGRTDEAQEIFTRVVEGDPKLTDAYSGLGWIYERKGEIDETIKLNRLAIKKDPQASFPHYELGRIFDQQGDAKKAVSEFKKAAQLNAIFAAPHDGIGVIYERQGRIDEAIDKFRLAIRIDRKFANSYVNLARIYAKQGRRSEALDLGEEAVRIERANRWVRASLAACYRRLGDEAEYAAQVAACRLMAVQPYENEYDKAGFEALCGNAEAVFPLLKIVLEKNQRAPVFINKDPDFDFIRNDPRFKTLVGIS